MTIEQVVPSRPRGPVATHTAVVVLGGVVAGVVAATAAAVVTLVLTNSADAWWIATGVAIIGAAATISLFAAAVLRRREFRRSAELLAEHVRQLNVLGMRVDEEMIDALLTQRRWAMACGDMDLAVLLDDALRGRSPERRLRYDQ